MYRRTVLTHEFTVVDGMEREIRMCVELVNELKYVLQRAYIPKDINTRYFVGC